MTTPTKTATYLYCVVKSEDAPALARGAKGLRGLASAAAPRTIDVGGGYHIVVATVPLALYSAEAIEAKLHDLAWVGAAASAHERVVEAAGRGGTVVPMKLFTIFSTDERAATHVRTMKRNLDRVVAKIAGCEEWGLRVLFDEARAAKATEKAAAAKAKKEPVTGTAFLLRKKAHDEARRRLTTAAKGEVDDLFARLEKSAKSALRRPPPNRELAGQVLLDAVFLVPEPRIVRFKSTVAASAKELAKEGYHVTLTGPWPAYSFIEGR